MIDNRLAEESWKALPQKVTVLYAKADDRGKYPEYCGTRGIPWEAGGTTLQG